MPKKQRTTSAVDLNELSLEKLRQHVAHTWLMFKTHFDARTIWQHMPDQEATAATWAANHDHAVTELMRRFNAPACYPSEE